MTALFIYTMTVALLSGSIYAHVPSVISLDATPSNLDSVAAGYAHRRQPDLFERLKSRMIRGAIQKVKAYVTWSEWAKGPLVQEYGAPADLVHVITPGSDLTAFSSSRERDYLEKVRVLFVGGNFQRKGGEQLVEAARERRLKGRIELHLVTNDPTATEGPDIFVHRGLTSNSEPLHRLFATSHIFALPTFADCLAMVLGEAMASSLPVITTNVDAHSEAIQDGVNGLIVKPRDAIGLVDALEKLVEDNGLRKSMGAAGRETAEERFDAQKNAFRILDLLKEVA
jgi:glycosyltransferase involved in cell wall biosynthesis